MNPRGMDDRSTIDQINESTGAGLIMEGRASAGALGGAILARWPDGGQAVITVFHGNRSVARRVATAVNELVVAGLPVPRHDLVVELEHGVAFVQQRLPSGPFLKFSEAQVDAILAVNERFAGAGALVTDVPPISEWFLPEGLRSYDRVMALSAEYGERAHSVVSHLVNIALANQDLLRGDDIVHVDLNAANVLFDERNHATGVVDWNLGIFTGPRDLALIQTRFDREWFVQMPSSDEGETAAANYLDRLIVERIDEESRRVWWAYWLLHWLPKAFSLDEQPGVLGWHLDLAEERVR